LKMGCRLFAIILILCILGSGTALAGFGGVQRTADHSISMLQSGATSEAHARDLLILTATKGNVPTALYQQAPPSSQQKRLLYYDVESADPTFVYCNGRYLPWNGFSGPFPKNAPLFWVDTSQGWSRHASLPLGSWVKELLYVPDDGTLKMYEIYPSGMAQRYVLGFPSSGYYYVWFYGDVPGKHITIFTIDDEPSNAVMINVLPRSGPIPPYPGAIVKR
jgi:hypothetical protein